MSMTSEIIVPKTGQRGKGLKHLAPLVLPFALPLKGQRFTKEMKLYAMELLKTNRVGLVADAFGVERSRIRTWRSGFLNDSTVFNRRDGINLPTIGQRINTFTVIGRAGYAWKLRCDCGYEVDRPACELSRKCRTCFGASCVDRRKAELKAREITNTGICHVCGKEFIDTALPECVKSRYCSKKCSNKKFSTQRRHIVRAEKQGVTVIEPVDSYAVFERDKWTCQVCGYPTPRELRGQRVPNAPQIDHEVALQNNGANTYENSRCCCLACNEAKALIDAQVKAQPDGQQVFNLLDAAEAA